MSPLRLTSQSLCLPRVVLLCRCDVGRRSVNSLCWFSCESRDNEKSFICPRLHSFLLHTDRKPFFFLPLSKGHNVTCTLNKYCLCEAKNVNIFVERKVFSGTKVARCRQIVPVCTVKCQKMCLSLCLWIIYQTFQKTIIITL